MRRATSVGAHGVLITETGNTSLARDTGIVMQTGPTTSEAVLPLFGTWPGQLLVTGHLWLLVAWRIPEAVAEATALVGRNYFPFRSRSVRISNIFFCIRPHHFLSASIRGKKCVPSRSRVMSPSWRSFQQRVSGLGLRSDISGAQKFARETSIIGGLFTEDQFRNPQQNRHT